VMAILDTSFQSGALGRVLPLKLTYKERAACGVSLYSTVNSRGNARG